MRVLDRTGMHLVAAASVDLTLEGDAAPESYAQQIAAAAVIAVNFPAFKDGRGFSLARVLRSRYGFGGDLRAIGAFLPDQAAFLVRCGFTSFAVADGFDETAFRRALTLFPRTYQLPLGGAQSIIAARHASISAKHWLSELTARYAGATAQDLLASVVTREFPGAVALVSSFGAESAVLLHMLAHIDPATPVLFLDTGKLFGETLRYRNALSALLGLRNVITISPDPQAVAARDSKGVLWSTDNDACCTLRKVEPLAWALAPYAAWITGRKAQQSVTRHGLPLIELMDGKFKINPLAGWSRADVSAYIDAHHLPRHPLEQDGYLSIGCTPCTDCVGPGEDVRAGRWRGRDKTECGIHGAVLRRTAS